MSVYTEKKQKTRQRIQEAFIQKLMEKPFDSITVGDLAKTAGINRGTFYLHYEDKFDLLEQMENQLFAELGYHIDQLQSHYLSAQTFESEQKQLADTLFLIYQRPCACSESIFERSRKYRFLCSLQKQICPQGASKSGAT